MQQRAVLLIPSDDCGWTDLWRALEPALSTASAGRSACRTIGARRGFR